MNATDVPHGLTPVAVTESDRKNFQRWLKVSKSLYAATRGMRERPEGLRSDHARITSGSVATGKDLRESVPRALAALVLLGDAEDNPRPFLVSWVGPFQDVADSVVLLLQRERDSMQRLMPFGLWCENVDCRHFIRPVALRLAQAPYSFFLSAVCARKKCQCVTVLWRDDDGVQVRRANDLKDSRHPMMPKELYDWVETNRQRPKRVAPLILP